MTLVGEGSLGGVRPLVSRHLVGFGILLLTMISGYVASRMIGQYTSVASADSSVPDAEESVTVADESTPSSLRIDDHLREVAVRYGVPGALVAAIIEAESEFNPHAISCRGARGLMQLMPATAASLGVGDPFDPRENIEAGVRHLRSLMDMFNNNLPLVVAAYNAGEHAVIAYRGIPPYPETRQYVNRVLRRLGRPRVTGSVDEAIAAVTAYRAIFGAIRRLDRCPELRRRQAYRIDIALSQYRRLEINEWQRADIVRGLGVVEDLIGRAGTESP